MFKKTYLGLAVSVLITIPVVVQAEVEVTAVLKNETAAFIKDGIRTGEATSVTDTSGEGTGLMKFENSARIFFNGDIGEESSWHGELNFIYDAEAVPSEYKGHRVDSQHDWFRELYIDTNAAGWDFRLGKQQVVWGTADGMKLLDIINPTDYREFSQNAMEESRIPIWMFNIERNIGESGNIQFLATEVEHNRVPGLDADADSGHPFIMKGVDTITGKVNGFFNIGKDFGAVATAFGPGTAGAATVAQFVAGNPGALEAVVAGAGATTNLVGSTAAGGDWDPANPDQMFEYVSGTAFGTFTDFKNMQTVYRKDTPDDMDVNLGLRYRGSLADSANYSINYLYNYDPNPVVNVHWEDSASGRELSHVFTGGIGDLRYADDNSDFGNAGTTAPTNPAQLVFVESLQRIHNLGASFDTAVDTKALGPVVLRGEFLYQKDVQTPIIDRSALNRGDLVGALKTQDTDFFKYVLGADVTVATDLLMSAQFIQFRNLDYVEENISSIDGSACSNTANCGRYTADPSTLHLSNGLQKGWENKEFYSLFMSKPFGESDLGRVNNILIYEEGGGYWNRLDAEYSLSDQLVVTGELNMYWGDENTTFGQFENSSSIQVGLKYLIE